MGRKVIVHQHVIVERMVVALKKGMGSKRILTKTNIQGPKKIWVPKSKYNYMNDGLLKAKLVH